MGGRFRSELSRAKDQLLSLLGVPDRGFFIQYRYSDRVQQIAEPYHEVEARFRACEPGFREILNRMGGNLAALSDLDVRNGGPDWQSSMFPPFDGVAAYTLAKAAGAETIVEVGSGDSTRYLDRAIKDSGRDTRLVCIDPAPRRSLEGLDVEWRRRVLGMEDLPLFAALKPDDILFIDSSHIMLPDMDVDILFNRIFPKLPPGVIVHVHDIFLPDPYPRRWVKRRYSEQNALIGWIVSGYFDVLFPGRYVMTRLADDVGQALGGIEPLRGSKSGSMWLRRAGE